MVRLSGHDDRCRLSLGEHVDGSVGADVHLEVRAVSVCVAWACDSSITLGTWTLQYPVEVVSET